MSASTKDESGIGGWRKLTGLPDFKKWSYKNSPYRVVVVKKRGHWTALFTSCYGPDSHTISGNNGGGMTGKVKAVKAAKSFMEENKYGCPPPTEYEE